MDNVIKDKDKYLNYYKNKYSSHFAPAILNYKAEKYFNMAVNSYDPKKGANFNTHLSSYMSKLNREANNKGATLKKTEYNKYGSDKILGIQNQIKTYEHREPTAEEIAKEAGVSIKKVQEVLDNNIHAAIVHGVNTSAIDVSPKDLLTGLQGDENKVLDTIDKNMKPDKAYKHTGLSKTKYYEIRKKVEGMLKERYVDLLKEQRYGVSGS